jgi:hypothetical protein
MLMMTTAPLNAADDEYRFSKSMIASLPKFRDFWNHKKRAAGDVVDRDLYCTKQIPDLIRTGKIILFK